MLAPSKNKAILEGPVCNGSQVIGWHTNEKSKRLRRFHVDMSGFAFNSPILWDPKRWRRPFTHPTRQLDTVKEGFQVWVWVFPHLWISLVCSQPYYHTDIVYFQAGDNIYRAGGGWWKRDGRCSTSLLEDTELASSLGCSGCPLSTRMGDGEEPRSSDNNEIVWKHSWLVRFIGLWTFEVRPSGIISKTWVVFGFGKRLKLASWSGYQNLHSLQYWWIQCNAMQCNACLFAKESSDFPLLYVLQVFT